MHYFPSEPFWFERKKTHIELNAQLTAFLETKDKWAFASFLTFDYLSTNSLWLCTCIRNLLKLKILEGCELGYLVLHEQE